MRVMLRGLSQATLPPLSPRRLPHAGGFLCTCRCIARPKHCSSRHSVRRDVSAERDGEQRHERQHADWNSLPDDDELNSGRDDVISEREREQTRRLLRIRL